MELDFTIMLDNLNHEVKSDPKVYKNLHLVVMEHITAMEIACGNKVTENVSFNIMMAFAEHAK